MGRFAYGRRRNIGRVPLAILLTLGLSVSAATAGSAATRQSSVLTPRHGGSFTEGVATITWPGLDPATDIQATADSQILDAIYGQLFEQGPGGSILPDQATGYKWSNHNLTLTIDIRHGMTFQDGTPFTAQAVASSIQRDLLPANACICDGNFAPVSSITASGPYTVVLQLSKLDSAIVGAFLNQAPNWTISPTALASKGETAFSQDPVGAGPFQVVSNTDSSSIVLTKFSKYWEKGHPYLNTLTFENTGTDQSSYAAVETGQVQLAVVYTLPVVEQAKTNPALKVETSPAMTYEFVQMNEYKAPFNNIDARLALQYATNARLIDQELYSNIYPLVEGPTGPADLYYYKTIPGYHGYNLAKAKALVQQLGGITFTIETLANNQQFTQEAEALAAMWNQAGMTVTVNPTPIGVWIGSVATHTFQAAVVNYGSVVPALDMNAFFDGDGLNSSFDDPVLDGLINQGTAFTDPTTLKKIALEIAERINSQSEAVFEYAHGNFYILPKDAEGVAQNIPLPNWEDVWIK